MAAYNSDQYLQEQKRANISVQHEAEGLMWHRFGSLYLPLALRKLVVMEAHRSAYSGHFGVDRVCAKLRDTFWWPRMRQTGATLLASCHECEVVAPRTTSKFGLLKPSAIPETCWEQLTLDLITRLPVSEEGYDACVVFVDRLSKMVHYAPCTKKITAKGMARL